MRHFSCLAQVLYERGGRELAGCLFQPITEGAEFLQRHKPIGVLDQQSPTMRRATHQIKQQEEPLRVAAVHLRHLYWLQHAIPVLVQLLKRLSYLLCPTSALPTRDGSARSSTLALMRWAQYSCTCLGVSMRNSSPNTSILNQSELTKPKHLRSVSAPFARVTTREVWPGRPAQRGTFRPTLTAACSSCSCTTFAWEGC